MAVPIPLSLLSFSTPELSSEMPDLPELKTPDASSQAEDEVELKKEQIRSHEINDVQNIVRSLSL